MNPYGNTSDNIDPNVLPACWCELRSNLYSSIYRSFNFVSVIILIPLLAVFGTFANVMNTLIFNRRRRECSSSESSTCVYLMALSISDGIINVIGALLFPLDSAKAYDTFLRRFASWFIIRILPVGIVASTCSIYFTVAAATDCYARTRSYNFCRKMFREKVATIVVICILLFSIIFNSVRLSEMECVRCWERLQNQSEYEICPTTFASSRFMEVYNMWISTIFGTLLPFGLLFLISTILIGTLRVRQNQARMLHLISFGTNFGAQHVFQGSWTSFSKSGRQRSLRKVRRLCSLEQSGPDEDSKALIMVVILFLICNSSNVVITIAERLANLPRTHLMINYLVDINNLLAMVNASVNIVIYYNFDEIYRKIVKNMLQSRKVSSSSIMQVPIVETVDDHQMNQGRSSSDRGRSVITPLVPSSPTLRSERRDSTKSYDLLSARRDSTKTIDLLSKRRDSTKSHNLSNFRPKRGNSNGMELVVSSDQIQQLSLVEDDEVIWYPRVCEPSKVMFSDRNGHVKTSASFSTYTKPANQHCQNELSADLQKCKNGTEKCRGNTCWKGSSRVQPLSDFNSDGQLETAL